MKHLLHLRALGEIVSVFCILNFSGLHAGEFTDDGAWCWFQDPRAVYLKAQHERTYASWMQAGGKLLVGYLDHSDHSTHSFVLKEQWDIDDHNTGSLLLLPDNRLMVFYARHNKRGLFARVSLKPESIDDWEPEITVADTPRITYSHPVYLAQEKKFFVFWRGSTWKPTFATSADGRHWSEPQVLIQQQGREARDIRPYLKVGNDGQSNIHFAFTDGHPRNEAHNSVYYMQYSKGKFHTVEGKVIGNLSEKRPVSHKACSVVYDARSSEARAWVWDVAQDSDGRPVVLYTRHPNEKDHRYHWARWTGSEWQDVELCQSGQWFPQTPEGVTEPEPHYSGGMSMNPMNPFQVCGSRQLNGQFEIVYWLSADGGNHWREQAVTLGSQSLNVRPAIPRGVPADRLHVLFMKGAYRHYTDYHTAIHWESIPSTGRN
jgi:hypothetical protein